jgi:hypothetical protein
MPRAQRTKSAVHEALQRRARHGPGVGFSEKLAGETKDVLLAAHSVVGFSSRRGLWRWHRVVGPSSRRIHVLAPEQSLVKPSTTLPA